MTSHWLVKRDIRVLSAKKAVIDKTTFTGRLSRGIYIR